MRDWLRRLLHIRRRPSVPLALTPEAESAARSQRRRDEARYQMAREKFERTKYEMVRLETELYRRYVGRPDEGA